MQLEVTGTDTGRGTIGRYADTLRRNLNRNYTSLDTLTSLYLPSCNQFPFSSLLVRVRCWRFFESCDWIWPQNSKRWNWNSFGSKPDPHFQIERILRSPKFSNSKRSNSGTLEFCKIFQTSTCDAKRDWNPNCTESFATRNFSIEVAQNFGIWLKVEFRTLWD